MSQDVLIRPDQFGEYDLQLDGSDFASAEGFETALPVSLFTDARAPASSVPDPLRRRGWFGNLLEADLDFELGGLLWLFEQSRLTPGILNRVRLSALGSLQWLIDDSAAREVEVTAVQPELRGIRITIRIVGLDNDVNQFSVLWRRTDATQLSSVSRTV